jgi:hypothetical protein
VRMKGQDERTERQEDKKTGGTKADERPRIIVWVMRQVTVRMRDQDGQMKKKKTEVPMALWQYGDDNATKGQGSTLRYLSYLNLFSSLLMVFFLTHKIIPLNPPSLALSCPTEKIGEQREKIEVTGEQREESEWITGRQEEGSKGAIGVIKMLQY